MIGRSAVALFAAAMTASAAMAEAKLLDFADLRGWADDNHAAAITAFQETCGDLKNGDWPALCAASKTQDNPRTFFETFFRPVLVTDGEPALFTAYYEPELDGSLSPSGQFNVPLYRRPDDAPSGGRWLTREQLETSGVLENRGLEIVWLNDPVEKFFLQIQGSGRIKLDDGGRLRVGYGGKNGHPYRSVGKELVRRGIFEDHQVSAQVIRTWVRNNPEEGVRLLWHNPSYVFFREVTQVPAEKGPLGAMNRSVTAGRSLAVDPKFVPLGAPVWLEKEGANPMQRLMIAQDTGSAIKGAQRADIFFGSGDEAGEQASRIRDTGRMVVLLPIEDALAVVASGS